MFSLRKGDRLTLKTWSCKVFAYRANKHVHIKKKIKKNHFTYLIYVNPWNKGHWWLQCFRYFCVAVENPLALFPVRTFRDRIPIQAQPSSTLKQNLNYIIFKIY